MQAVCLFVNLLRLMNPVFYALVEQSKPPDLNSRYCYLIYANTSLSSLWWQSVK